MKPKQNNELFKLNQYAFTEWWKIEEEKGKTLDENQTEQCEYYYRFEFKMQLPWYRSLSVKCLCFIFVSLLFFLSFYPIRFYPFRMKFDGFPLGRMMHAYISYLYRNAMQCKMQVTKLQRSNPFIFKNGHSYSTVWPGLNPITHISHGIGVLCQIVSALQQTVDPIIIFIMNKTIPIDVSFVTEHQKLSLNSHSIANISTTWDYYPWPLSSSIHQIHIN